MITCDLSKLNKFHRTHEEERDINFTSCYCTSHLTTKIAQILTNHVTMMNLYDHSQPTCGQSNNLLYLYTYVNELISSHTVQGGISTLREATDS